MSFTKEMDVGNLSLGDDGGEGSSCFFNSSWRSRLGLTSVARADRSVVT